MSVANIVNALQTFLSRLLASLSWRRHEPDLEAEIHTHLQFLADEYQRQGMSPEDARHAARREFGGVAQVKDTYRDHRRLPALDTFIQDVQYALRAMRRSPSFTAVAVLT